MGPLGYKNSAVSPSLTITSFHLFIKPFVNMLDLQSLPFPDFGVVILYLTVLVCSAPSFHTAFELGISHLPTQSILGSTLCLLELVLELELELELGTS